MADLINIKIYYLKKFVALKLKLLANIPWIRDKKLGKFEKNGFSSTHCFVL